MEWQGLYLVIHLQVLDNYGIGGLFAAEVLIVEGSGDAGEFAGLFPDGSRGAGDYIYGLELAYYFANWRGGVDVHLLDRLLKYRFAELKAFTSRFDFRNIFGFYG